MAKIVPLFSSSSGNSYYIEGNGKAVLVDAGRNCKQIENALFQNGLSMDNVSAVFVSHEHSDHISALKVLLKKYPRPVFGTLGTITVLENEDKIPAGTKTGAIEDTLDVGDFEVRRIQTSHDAKESCGFFITTPDKRSCSIVTDTGILTDDAKAAIRRSSLAVLESNHDLEMLKYGGYPYILKKRILSDRGHLSNAACAEALPAFIEAGLQRVILAHLSQQNNTADIALAEAVTALSRAGMKKDFDYIIDVASPENFGKAMVF